MTYVNNSLFNNSAWCQVCNALVVSHDDADVRFLGVFTHYMELLTAAKSENICSYILSGFIYNFNLCHLVSLWFFNSNYALCTVMYEIVLECLIMYRDVNGELLGESGYCMSNDTKISLPAFSNDNPKTHVCRHVVQCPDEYVTTPEMPTVLSACVFI